MKMLFNIVINFVKNNKIFCAMIGLIALFMLVGLCSCSPGTVASDISEDNYMNVAGIYEITEGTQEITINIEDDKQVNDITGYYVEVSQNTLVVSGLGCLGFLQEAGFVGCGGTVLYSLDPWYGPVRATVKGSMTFFDDSVDAQVDISGNYEMEGLSYTILYDVKAVRVDFDE